MNIELTTKEEMERIENKIKEIHKKNRSYESKDYEYLIPWIVTKISENFDIKVDEINPEQGRAYITINDLSVNILVKKRVIEAAVFDYQYIVAAPKLYYKAGIDVTDFIEDLREVLTRRR